MTKCFIGALKYKRFKTLVLDYIDLVPELDDIDWVYYLDIDVLMGAPFHNLLHNLEEKYSIGSDSEDGENEDEDKELVSKLYVFKDHGDATSVVGNSGFIIMNRRTSGYCLDLWRTEIDDHPEARFDQASLTTVALMDDSEKEMQCQVIPMEREEFISYPVRSYTLQNMMAESSYTPLIHILNSYKANAIGSYVTEKFVKNVLQLSEEEVEEHKFGKAVIRPSWYDWRKNTSEITALRISTMPELGLV